MSNVVAELSRPGDRYTLQVSGGACFGNSDIVQTNRSKKSTIASKLPPSKKRSAPESKKPYQSYIKKVAMGRTGKEMEERLRGLLSSPDYTVVTPHHTQTVIRLEDLIGAENTGDQSEERVEPHEVLTDNVDTTVN
jgi:hypothetical protein